MQGCRHSKYKTLNDEPGSRIGIGVLRQLSLREFVSESTVAGHSHALDSASPLIATHASDLVSEMVKDFTVWGNKGFAAEVSMQLQK